MLELVRSFIPKITKRRQDWPLWINQDTSHEISKFKPLRREEFNTQTVSMNAKLVALENPWFNQDFRLNIFRFFRRLFLHDGFFTTVSKGNRQEGVKAQTACSQQRNRVFKYLKTFQIYNLPLAMIIKATS